MGKDVDYLKPISISEKPGLSGVANKADSRNWDPMILGNRCHFYEGNVFDARRVYAGKNEMFDLVILDPPTFSRDQSTFSGASRGYEDINLRTMEVLRSGGFLMTCSFHM
ncbi:MAG: hypothetical protein HOH43_10430 [Candidatus Latescibacteria bacterium]|nr:hypothetical protein [Candidatus Latescibacterota bacterium]